MQKTSRQHGLTLIELVVFMVVISIGLAGILGALNLTTRNSANPMLLKQQLAIAESLLEEIESKPFTWCDPDDANVTMASGAFVGAGGCAATTQLLSLSPTAGESRDSQTVPFDNVADFGGLNMNAGILNPSSGAVISGLGSYTATVTLTPVGDIAPTNVGAADAVLKIDVKVSMTGQADLTLTGYRYRYAPNVP
ncbi:type IV pilus modification PilV family protein [Uliginosibacterium flavum]|uniref:Prepilin-type N-terminal cleavage/methylation domain-containing protein n=1 Tax=Uliginosibacterium flavum TaxID=1396831 RepID=A0ABV2TMG7_9RHOO